MTIASEQVGTGIGRRFTDEGVDPYDEIEWDSAAQLIWGTDLLSDNTVLLRATVES